MSEYWKSTPKYWCKYCTVYVKDTKRERAQHEATGRHQGSIQRSLRGLHREQEAEERKVARAKAEVERLNGLVPSSASAAAPANTPKPTYTKEVQKKDTLEDRKRQWAQLAAMGVAVPEEARSENALAGEWRVVSTKVVGEEEKKPLSMGVRKRKLDEEEEEALAAGEIITKKKGWGHTFKSFPGKLGGGGDDVEALFNKVKKPVIKEDEGAKEELGVKVEQDVKEEVAQSALLDIPAEGEVSEKVAGNAEEKTTHPEGEAAVKAEEDAPAPAIVFKKRKKVAR
ncbi:U1 zinc finger domain-containing protein [Melanomma pulvis-pyrius CBS 109.77]|uniref:U1 zinc finger domain-containing protein n=1 Tax=Melanomma pulvis-pyrius CBS 109.77 TaxID=1314802 RepID=A0A6A6XLF5_9PLEO|nr:U1 zinc finger domain-containing protein [Melanomma pulvis-pyrius CBS 109.77]